MTFATRLSTLFATFARDDAAQDLVEYSLLAALVGIASIAAWQQLRDIVGASYAAATAAGGTVQGLSACTPNPGGGGC